MPVSIDDSVPAGSIPIGLGIDLGVITEIDEKLSIGLSLDNLLASFNWDGATIYSARAQGEIKPDEITEADSLSDLLSQSDEFNLDKKAITYASFLLGRFYFELHKDDNQKESLDNAIKYFKEASAENNIETSLSI